MSTKEAERRSRPLSQAGTAVQKNQEADLATSIAARAIFAGSSETVATASAVATAASASSHDRRRTWLWCFLAIVAASQLYFVRELFAAYAIFTSVFIIVALVVIGLYMLFKSAELAFLRFSGLRNAAGTLASASAPALAPVASLASVAHGEHNAA